MQIADNTVVSIHYTLKDDEGTVIDSSAGQEPLDYLHGAQNIVPGLENELTGKAIGDQVNCVVEPEQGYGDVDPELIQELPSSMFSGVDQLEVGMEFHAETQNGLQVVEVIGIEGDTVTINGNHPLAGVRLHFDVEVVGIRAATDEELSHGHAHGPDGHHHH